VREDSTVTTLPAWLAWVDRNLQREAAARRAVAALMGCAPEDRVKLLQFALDALRPGPPVTPFGNIMAEAHDWADMACRDEHKAYCLACFIRLRPADRQAFRKFIDRKAAA
jgi:hypothetical protein